jgi:hypothetical protein
VEKDNTDIRYRIVELLGYWAGLVNTTQLMQHFSISRTQAQKYLTSYQADYPDNLVSDNRLKGFKPSEYSTSHCISSDVRDSWVRSCILCEIQGMTPYVRKKVILRLTDRVKTFVSTYYGGM